MFADKNLIARQILNHDLEQIIGLSCHHMAFGNIIDAADMVFEIGNPILGMFVQFNAHEDGDRQPVGLAVDFDTIAANDA